MLTNGATDECDLYQLLLFELVDEYVMNDLFSVVFAHYALSEVTVILYVEVVCGANADWYLPLKSTFTNGGQNDSTVEFAQVIIICRAVPDIPSEFVFDGIT